MGAPPRWAGKIRYAQESRERLGESPQRLYDRWALDQAVWVVARASDSAPGL